MGPAPVRRKISKVIKLSNRSVSYSDKNDKDRPEVSNVRHCYIESDVSATRLRLAQIEKVRFDEVPRQT